jgi:hypothetical protein
MIAEAHEVRSTPSSFDFYPDPHQALGIRPAVYLNLYPQGYFGYAKNSAPVFISKPSAIDVNSLYCCLSLENIMRYHWHAMQVEFVKELSKSRASNSGSGDNPAQCVCIVDLRGLSASQLNKRTLRVIREQSAIDSACYPEILCKMIVLSVPGFFNFSWKIIKGFVDKRTASKIELIGNREKGEVRDIFRDWGDRRMRER